ncbi:peptidase [Nitrosopumilus oxyclinae]|uniref:Peptidase n=1 Tax=Nitrosopumilus oxyclinae TaxID=1959104 RepID=A0A7D5R0U5_9ARCH|nr:peptidase [Nitrosopumilus oxyclinae]QLH04740.1 peptidase [Nitrosopumilus oxyclinae]
MKTIIAAISTIALLLVVTSSVSSAYAEVPGWVKNNAGWWADGAISESEFISGIEFLITDGIIVVPPTTVSSETSNGVPDWVKNNAGWWADGTITDGEFVNGIQHLIKSGLISVSVNSVPVQVAPVESNSDSKLAALEAELEKCSEILKAYKRIDCEKPIDKAIMLYKYKTNAEHFDLGPITYHWFGVGSEGNEFEITSSGQAILSIRMLAENTSSEITAIHCTSPAICAYDIWDGSKAFKYSGMDFTSGEIVLNPGDSREFNILFGPNIGYGGTEFKYDPSKSYTFRINENFGSANIPLKLE